MVGGFYCCSFLTIKTLGEYLLKVFTVLFFSTFSLFFVVWGVADEVPIVNEMPFSDNLLTLSMEEIQMVSRAFSFACDQMDRLHVSPEQVAPYLYLFVRRCERLVLENGSFPHDFSADLFDVQFASALGVEVSDSFGSSFYSQLAVHLLHGVWRNSIKSDVQSFMELGVYDPDESFNLALTYSEEIYVSSAILSALTDGPHDPLSDRLGLSVDLLLSTSEKRKIAADNLYRKQTGEQIQLLTEKVVQSRTEQVRGERILRKFVISLFVFPLVLSINVLSVAVVLFAVRQRRYNRLHFFPRH